jgi:Ca2+-binding RTX toxin-like protein
MLTSPLLQQTSAMHGSAAAAVDDTPPTIIASPTLPPADADLVFKFSEAVRAGHGTIGVRVWLGDIIFSFDPGDPAISISGDTLTIHLPQRLDYAAQYLVEFSEGALTDLAGNALGRGYDGMRALFRTALSPVAVDLAGTDGNDTLDGSDLADTISGGAGSDTIKGHGGDDIIHGGSETTNGDSIEGGAGDDTLYGEGGRDILDGGAGNDKLYGGDDHDFMTGGDGDDLLDGGAGDDDLLDTAGTNTLLGGDGNDVLNGGATGMLDGGAGNDTLSGYDGIDYYGGYGNDRISVTIGAGTTRATRVDGGGGDDLITFILGYSRSALMTVSGGAGRDTFVFSGYGSPYMDRNGLMMTITDFTPGTGGDVLDIDRWVNHYAKPGNPFLNGTVRLLADGNDTLLQLGQNDAGPSWVTAVRLEHVRPDQFTSANFAGSIDPGGGPKGLSLNGGEGHDTLTGSALDDTLSGRGGNDILSGMGGNDLLDGGGGRDSAVYRGARSDYQVGHDAAGWHVRDLRATAQELADGNDTLQGIERMVFADRTLALDTDGAAGQAYLLYRAAFDRAPDLAGLGFWIDSLEKGVALHDAGAGFVNSQEFKDLYGASSGNAEVLTKMYHNILHREPDPDGYAFWLRILENGQNDVATVLVELSDSVENRTAVADIIAEGILFTPYMG